MAIGAFDLCALETIVVVWDLLELEDKYIPRDCDHA